MKINMHKNMIKITNTNTNTNIITNNNTNTMVQAISPDSVCLYIGLVLNWKTLQSPHST